MNRLDSDKLLILFTMQCIYNIKIKKDLNPVVKAIEQYNNKLIELSNSRSNIRIIHISDFFNNYSIKDLIDWKYYFIAQIPLNPKLSIAFMKWFQRQIEIIELKRKKCIVLDLDNTLWGGILGEDGIEGIKIGEGYPGKVFQMFQKFILELNKNGIIISICSKNNENDVLEVIEKHPNQILMKEDIIAYRINWNNKADNIAELAKELNIGLDSMVFIDDNPSERELIKQALPMVEVPNFPDHIYLYPEFMKQLVDNYFSTYKLTDEDLNKNQQYKENARRFQFKTQFSDFESYLKSLLIELTVESISKFNITRFAQMTQKTNQFNLTTHRYTESDIQSIAKDGGWVYGLRVIDKFGDNGLTALAIIRMSEKKTFLDTYLMSCRVLGKNIEFAFLAYLLNKLKSFGIKEVSAEYIKSTKNIMAIDFFDKMGFSIVSQNITTKFYMLDLNSFEYKQSNNYKLIEKL